MPENALDPLVQTDAMVSPEMFALRGHRSTLAGLWRSARDERLPQALLFRGNEGIGKYLAMRLFATGLLCSAGPGPPCGRCGPCKRIASDNHPDYLTIDLLSEDEQEEFIRVARIVERGDRGDGRQSVEEFLSLRAHEGGWRTVLVREAERMNEAAQNAFLKMLEEPAPRTLIALESSFPDRLLTTVRSRLISVECLPPGPEATAQILAQLQSAGRLPHQQDAEGDAIPLVARWSGGAPGRALRLLRQGVPAIREALIRFWEGRSDAVQTAAVLWDLEGDFPGKTAAARHRARARAVLETGLDCLGDLYRAACGVDGQDLAHGDLWPRLRGAASGNGQAWTEARLRKLVDEWLRARQDIGANMSAEAALDRALLGSTAVRTEC